MDWLKQQNLNLSRRHDGNSSQSTLTPAAAFFDQSGPGVYPGLCRAIQARPAYLPTKSAASPEPSSTSDDERRRTLSLHSPVQVDRKKFVMPFPNFQRALVRVQGRAIFLDAVASCGCSVPADRVLEDLRPASSATKPNWQNFGTGVFSALSRRARFSSLSLPLPGMYALGIGQGLGKGSGTARRTHSTAREA